MRRKIWKKLREQRGVGTIEVVLLLVVIVALVIIFKDQISGMIESIFGNINSSINQLY